ncbi:MAG: RNA pseudouridine synthase [Lentisphaeria bacterium]|nr:RNA pseudouridine synthase [Lentisphaeria bacterium]NQZ68978.1 RNA pseudouridine synthase [Lentisphaeria bacterium]
MIETVYEDNHLLVVNKPVGLIVQADSNMDSDLLTILKDELKERHNKPGNVYLGLVHRLDRNVGGLMVFAKSSKAASRLSEAIRERKFIKHYLAITQKVVPEPNGRLVSWIKKDSRTNKSKVRDHSYPGAKEAILEFEVLCALKGKTVIRVELITGRPHQIRAQFAHIGHPLVGDIKYGGHKRTKYKIALFSHKLEFAHPTTKETMKFELKPSWQELQLVPKGRL